MSIRVWIGGSVVGGCVVVVPKGIAVHMDVGWVSGLVEEVEEGPEGHCFV